MLRRGHRFLLPALLGLAALQPPAGAAAPAPLQLDENDRLLVLAAHPDDETLAAGGLIQEALALGTPVRIAYATLGDNHEIAALFTRLHPSQMSGPLRAGGTRRRNEAAAAAGQLGLAPEDLVFLGYPDSGLLDIWNNHWRTVPPYRSPLTRANAVSYAGALTPGSAYAGEDLLDDLAEVLRDFRPTLVVAPHPADHDPDHRALDLLLRVALWDLAADGVPPPRLLAAPVHFTQWPLPRQAQPRQPAAPPEFLAHDGPWLEYALAPFQATNKLAALRRHHSQFQAAAPCLAALVRKNELFGDPAGGALPGGTGTAGGSEEDATRFHPDAALLADLARSTDAWQAIADQQAAENTALGGRENRIIERFLSGDGTFLTCSFLLDRPLAPDATATVRLFGYNSGTPFGEMPKISITAASGRILAAQDLDRELPAGSVEAVAGEDDEITVRVPYALLGQPARLLLGVELAQGPIPVDWIPWRAIDLQASPAAPAEPPAARPAPPANPPPAPVPPQAPAKPAPSKSAKAAPAAPKAAPPVVLVPRVELPRAAAPRREADEPVLW